LGGGRSFFSGQELFELASAAHAGNLMKNTPRGSWPQHFLASMQQVTGINKVTGKKGIYNHNNGGPFFARFLF
jgi:hypothetical protein